jgi:uncharacterized repeat protein (TIGR02543 family)
MKNAKKNARALAIAAALACAVLAFAGCSDSGSGPSGGDPGPTYFTVTFDPQGGGSVPQAKVQSGAAASEPTNVADGDLVFAGWYTEAACSTRWNFNDPVAKDMTLYAKWNAADTLSFASISGGAAWEVAKGSGALDADLYIPAYYKGIPVKSLAMRGFYGAGLTKVILSYGITDIGQYAFCTSSLSSIQLPSSLETLGYGALMASNIASISIPASVRSIADCAMGQCRNLAQIAVEDGSEYFKIVNGSLYDKAGTYLYQYPLAMPGTAYSIPVGVTEVGGGAFMQSSLVEISIPDGVTTFHDTAFAECSALHSINIPTSVTSMGNRVFAYSFTSTPSVIFIPDSVASIGAQGFWACGKLSIHCQAPSQPEGWADNWKQDVPNPVAWGCDI